jgi:aminopeptidase N
MIRSLLLMLAFAVAAVSANAATTAQPVRYDLKAQIEPGAGTVAVRGTIGMQLEPGARQMTFALHRSFAIRTLRVDGVPAKFSYQTVEPTPFNPAVRNVVVDLPAHAAATLKMDIAYDGKLEVLPEWGASPDPKTLSMDDQVNSRMVQLASYSAWYPLFAPFGHHFQTELEISLPKGWTAVSGGDKRDVAQDGRAVTHWSVQDNFDLAFAAAPNFKVIKTRSSGVEIEIYHTQMPDAVIAGESTELAAVTTMFTDALGSANVPGGTIRHVYSPMRKGQGRAGIARAGVIITSEGRMLDALAGDPNYSLLQDLAHEVAHFWWHFGSGQGDWVNEAFAEYSSAIAVREIGSKERFEGVLAYYRKCVGGLPATAPSLATVPQQGGDFYVRYYKGSLMLDDFRRSMGDEAFVAAAREFYQTYKNTPTGTAEFRAFWRTRVDGARLDAWLDQGGPALPASTEAGR